MNTAPFNLDEKQKLLVKTFYRNQIDDAPSEAAFDKLFDKLLTTRQELITRISEQLYSEIMDEVDYTIEFCLSLSKDKNPFVVASFAMKKPPGSFDGDNVINRIMLVAGCVDYIIIHELDPAILAGKQTTQVNETLQPLTAEDFRRS